MPTIIDEYDWSIDPHSHLETTHLLTVKHCKCIYHSLSNKHNYSD